MRFPLFRRLSHLIHRRAKSESFAGITPFEPLDALTRSYSLNNLGEQARPTNVDTFVPRIVIPPPHALDTPPGSPTFAYASPIRTTPRMQPYKLAAVSQRILELEHELGLVKAENGHLKDANCALKFDMELLQEQLSFLEHAERPLSSDVRLITKEALEILKAQARRCLEMDRFVRTIIGLGLKTEEPIFPRIHRAIIAGETHDEAVVETIRDAAAKPGSPWSTIIPAVIGPRTNEQYLSALNMTLQCRKENKELQSVKKFWKNVAKDDPANADLITPSSSNLSSVQVVLPEKRQRAVDDLLVKLRNGSVPIRSQVISQAPEEYCHATTSSVPDIASIPPATLKIDTAPAAHLSPRNSCIPFSSSDVSATLPYLCNSSVHSLPPLASQTFKQQLIASHSSERFSISTTYKNVLGSRDLNASESTSTPLEPVVEKIEPTYTLPEFPCDFSDSSDLDFSGPSTSIVSASVESTRFVERGSLSALEEDEELEEGRTCDLDSDDAEQPDRTLVDDSSFVVDVPKNTTPKKSLLPVMKKHRGVPLTPTKMTRPNLPMTPSKSPRPSTPSPTKPAFKSSSPLKSRPALPSPNGCPVPPSPSSLHKPTISSMKKTVPVPRRVGSEVAIRPTSPLRIKKRRDETEVSRKRMSALKRLSRMVLGS